MSGSPDHIVIDKSPRESLLLTTIGHLARVAGNYAAQAEFLIKSDPLNKKIYGLPAGEIAAVGDSLNDLGKLLLQLGANPAAFSAFRPEMSIIGPTERYAAGRQDLAPVPAPALVIFCVSIWEPRSHIALRPGEKDMDLPARKEMAFSWESLNLLRTFIATLAKKSLR